MSITYHERPGVYSDVDASSVTASTAGAKTIAIAARSSADAGLYSVTDALSAETAFGADSSLAQLIRLAFQNGAGLILAAPVAADTTEAYTSAIALLMAEKRASFVLTDSVSEAVHSALLSAVEAASSERGECIGLVGLAEPEVAELTARAAVLNSERMVVVGPDVCLSGETAFCGGSAACAALAGVLAGQTDPALPLNGQALAGLGGVSATYNDTELDMLIRGGVTVLEPQDGKICVVRGITSRTTTGGAPDSTWRELTTTLIIDDVIPAVRSALRARFARAKNNAATRSAIRSQVVVELEARLAREIIESYDSVTATADPSDPTICLVEFGFTVTHGLNRIHLTAHISV